MLKQCKIYACAKGTLGLHLSRAPWDPYPWVSEIQKGSSAQRVGMRVGDTVLELNGCDVLGQKISEIAAHIREHLLSGGSYVLVVIWRTKTEEEAVEDAEEHSEGSTHASINQQSLQKFATCLQHIAQLLECPVCLEVIKPPGWQCCNGHVLCNNCRSRSVKCPVCRVPLGPRGRCLLSDKLFTVLAENFPCDGVKSNKSSPMEKRKCTPDFHNQPKMAVVTMQQRQQIKAKETKRKVKTLCQTNERLDKTGAEAVEKEFATEKRPVTTRKEQKYEAEEEEEAAAAVEEEAVKYDKSCARNQTESLTQTQTNAKNNTSIICLRRKSRTVKVYLQHEQQQQQQQQQPNEIKILKSQEDKRLSISNSNESYNSSAEKSQMPATYTVSAMSAESTASSSCSKSSGNSFSNNNNALVKLKLKSSQEQADYSAPSVGEFTGQSHELQDDKVTIVNNGMLAIQQQSQQEQQQQQLQHTYFEQQQHQQNYHCPTGKSCCSYVKTFPTDANVRLTKTTTTTLDLGEVVIQHNNNNNNNYSNNAPNNNNNNNNINSDMSTTCKTFCEGSKQLMYISSSKLSNCCDSLSCNKNCTLASSSLGMPHALAQRKEHAAYRTLTTTTSNDENQSPTQHIFEQVSTRQGKMFLPASAPPQQTEWQIFAHLTQEHHLSVTHFYGTFCQRIHVDFMHHLHNNNNNNNNNNLKSIACLNLQYANVNFLRNYENVNNYKVEKFFLACIPLENLEGTAALETPTKSTARPATMKNAIFLWHLLADNGTNAVEIPNFETIIESQRTGIKWFGCSQPLTKSWSQIHAEGHFLMHETSVEDQTDAFEIVIRIK